MNLGLDEGIITAVNAFIGDRKAGEVVHGLYHSKDFIADDALNALANLLPIEQIAAVALVDRLNLLPLQTVVILAIVLHKIHTNEGWIHYNLSKHLRRLIDGGIPEAKLPAIIHALLALDGLENSPTAQPFLLSLLARELAPVAPREAIRRGMLATRGGDSGVLHSARDAFDLLGLKAMSGSASISQMLLLAKTLNIGAENVPQVTNVDHAAGLRTVPIEKPERITFPAAHGDASHYIFAQAEKTVPLPGIAVHTLECATFSIDATARGMEQHYLFDRNMDCVEDLSNGTQPFITESILEYNEPVAILDDRFSGAMNICHFLLDRVTRIPIYERAWGQRGKFFLVENERYYRDIFLRMGLSDRVIIPPSLRISVRAPEILFSSNIAGDFRHPAHNCAGWAIEYLRRALGIADRPARPGNKLMVYRPGTVGRGILNWEEVLPIFQRHGFDIVELAALSTDAQIALFRDAAQVVGVHGAGLTNLLFAPRDCAVLEILPPLVAVHDYWLLASSLGQRYYGVIAEDPELPRPDYATWQHSPDSYNSRDVVLPAKRLEVALEWLE